MAPPQHQRGHHRNEQAAHHRNNQAAFNGNNTGAPYREPRQHDPHRAYFDKLLGDDGAVMRDPGAARRFADAMKGYNDADLLWRLARRDSPGLRRIHEAVQLGGVVTAVAIIQTLMQTRWSEPKDAAALRSCVCDLWAVPQLIEELSTAVARRVVHAAEELKALIDFGLAVALATPQAQHGPDGALCVLATALVDQSAAGTARRRAERLRLLVSGPFAGANLNGGDAVDHLPGGRHKHDHVDFRKIDVFPSIEETFATIPPFLPRASADAQFLHDDPEAQLLDRNFRLLREDFQAALRESLRPGESKQHFHVKVNGIELHKKTVIDERTHMKSSRIGPGPASARLCFHPKHRKPLLQELMQSGRLRRGNLCLLVHARSSEPASKILTEMEPIAFARVVCAPDSVKTDTLSYYEMSVTADDLALLIGQRDWMELHIVGGSYFAYEPVLLALQKIVELPFAQEVLLQRADGGVEFPLPPDYDGADQILLTVEQNLAANASRLDPTQLAAFEHAASHRVANIVGPPGTGKTFVGVELAHAILEATDQSLLLVCYTNHALDQFLSALVGKGWGHPDLVRVGGASKDESLEQFTLFTLAKQRGPAGASRRRLFEVHEAREDLHEDLFQASKLLCEMREEGAQPRWAHIREFLIAENETEALQALSPPRETDGFMRMGKKLQAEGHYLWERWYQGKDAGVFTEQCADTRLWKLNPKARRELAAQWNFELTRTTKLRLNQLAGLFNGFDKELAGIRTTGELDVLKRARIIGATTTGVAKYRSLLKNAGVGVLFIEEAGEVLEAHSLASMLPGVKHVINIGDHKQLRPKVETHALTVGAGNFDLNRSLFERLVLGGAAHCTLELQHRMRPEISRIAREMTYPELRDDAGVHGRPDVLGLAKNVAFIDHRELEDGWIENAAPATGPLKQLSKCNAYEVRLTVQIVRFVLAQGYKLEDLVVLTPYLGQLRALKEALGQEARLGERDVREINELLFASNGEQPVLEMRVNGGVRISTVDNYQGEEAEIVIASLVRSNPKRRIGFLGKADAEQRLNVLCTRARAGFIFVGNAQCLEVAPHWQTLLRLLRERGAVVRGLPTKCQVHSHEPDPSLLSTPEQIEARVGRGAGCGRKCDEMLPCGHPCPLDCHPLDRAHAGILCHRLVRTDCSAGTHRIDKECHEASAPFCRTKVVEPCGHGHFVVRQCGARAAACRVCALLIEYEQKAAEATAQQAQEEACLIEQAARTAVAAAATAAAAAAATPSVPGGPADQEASASLEGSSAEEAENNNDFADAAEDLDTTKIPTEEETQAALRELAARYEARQRRIQQELGAKLDQQQRQAQKALEAAQAELLQREATEKEQLQARRAAAEEEIHAVEARLNRQSVEAAEAREADLLEQDAKLRALHDALTEDLRQQDVAFEAANARPSAEALAALSEQMPTDTCAVCFDDKIQVLQGVQCCSTGAGHFVCDECFSSHVKAGVERQEFDGEVRCPMASAAMREQRCTSKSYAVAVLARHAAADVFEAFNKKRLELREATIVRKMEQGYEERLERRTQEIRAERDLKARKVKDAREHIAQKILTLACPKCGRAFVDFDGCLALSCKCGCGFCALCLKDCGEDAHSHLATCALVRGDLYGRNIDFEAIHAERRQKAVKGYLAGNEHRDEILAACERELRDLKLWPL